MKTSEKPAILKKVYLAPYTTLNIGGPAKYFTNITSVDELVSAISWAKSKKIPVFILGGGSNIVISDTGFAGLVIKMDIKGIEILKRDPEGILVKTNAGQTWDNFVSQTVDNNWAGIECLSGIPGTAGAAPIQNIGAYGQEVKNTITKVHVLDTSDLKIKTLSNKQCRFSYRNSVFKKKKNFVVTSVTFRLYINGTPSLNYQALKDAFIKEHGSNYKPNLKEVREKVIQIRREKSMIFDPLDKNSMSVGSFFVNPIINKSHFAKLQKKYGNAIPFWETENKKYKLAAAWLIEQSGFKRGFIYKNVGISEKHALSIINRGGGNFSEISELVEMILKKVKTDFNVLLDVEPYFLK